jgi:hypothetical protein
MARPELRGAVELDASTKIAAAFARFHGWTYDAERPQVPERIPGVPAGVEVATALPGRTSCSPLTAWCVLAAFPELRASRPHRSWGAINVVNHHKPWSPVVGWPGFSAVLPSHWTPGVYLTQGWRRVVDGVVDVSAGGHSRLVEVLPGDEGLLVREASRSAGVVRERIEAPDAWKRWGAETRAVRLG